MDGRATCTGDGCAAPIVWALTEGGRRIPLNPDPHPDGTVILTDHDGRTRARILTGPELPAQQTAWQAHWATCPASSTFRRRKGATTPKCRACRLPLHQLAVDAGWTTHPLCGPPEEFRALVEAAASTQETPS